MQIDPSICWLSVKHPRPYIEASIRLLFLFARYIYTKLPGLCKAYRSTMSLILQTLQHSTKPTFLVKLRRSFRKAILQSSWITLHAILMFLSFQNVQGFTFCQSIPIVSILSVYPHISVKGAFSDPFRSRLTHYLLTVS